MEPESELVAKLEADRRHSRRVIFWLIVVVIAIPVFGVLAAYSYDCNPSDDRDMLPVWTEVPIKENGLGQFQEWLESHPVPTITGTPGLRFTESDWKIDEARKLVGSYTVWLAEFVALSRKDISKWRWKEGEKMARYDAKVLYLSQIQALANVARHQAKIRLADGKPEEAADLGFVLTHVGRGMQCQGTMLDFLVASTVQMQGLTTLAEVEKHAPDHLPMPAKWKAAMIMDDSRADVMRDALKVEYEFFRSVMRDVKAGTFDSATLSGSGSDWMEKFGVRPNRTLRRYIEVQRPVVSASTLSWNAVRRESEKQMAELKRTHADWWSVTMLLLRGNPGGERMVVQSLPTLANIETKSFLLRAQHRITFTQFAIREYELAHGGLPKMLADLVPAQLPAVPVDPFDDKPLRWNRETATIYSVGPDQTDDGGLIDEDRPTKGKDIGQRYWWSKTPPKK